VKKSCSSNPLRKGSQFSQKPLANNQEEEAQQQEGCGFPSALPPLYVWNGTKGKTQSNTIKNIPMIRRL
jgi:hypothetical protein